MDNIANEVFEKHQAIRQEYKQLTNNILIFNEKKKDELREKFKIENQKIEYYHAKFSKSYPLIKFYWRIKFLNKKYTGKKLIVEFKKTKNKADKIAVEIEKFKDQACA